MFILFSRSRRWSLTSLQHHLVRPACQVQGHAPVQEDTCKLCHEGGGGAAGEESPGGVAHRGTGCGNTNKVPQFPLEGSLARGMGSTTTIVVTQPRRISAIIVAERVAWERGWSVGRSAALLATRSCWSPGSPGCSGPAFTAPRVLCSPG